MRKQICLAASVAWTAMLIAPQAVQAQTLTEVSADTQVKDDLFAGTEIFKNGASDVSEVNLDQKTMSLVGGKGKRAELAKKLDFIVVHSYTYDKPGMYKMADLQVFRQKLLTGDWSCMVHEQTKTESTDVCMRSGADHETNELVVIDAEPKEISFVHIKGRMSLADLQSMQNLGGGGPATPTPPEPPLKKR